MSRGFDTSRCLPACLRRETFSRILCYEFGSTPPPLLFPVLEATLQVIDFAFVKGISGAAEVWWSL